MKVQTEKAGDCQARALVRVREMRESIRIVRELIDNVPEGPIIGTKPVKTPTQYKAKAGQAYACLESPRGEVGAYVIGGGANRGACPYRVKFRSPSLHALAALPYILPGHSVSDCVAVLGSLDPILGEVDR